MMSQLEPANLLHSLWWLVSQPTTLCTGLTVYITWKIVYALYFSSLRNVPGSLLGRISSLPLLVTVLRGGLTDWLLSSYEKYDSLFIMSNKAVVVCDPSDCRTILSTHAFKKAMFSNVDLIEPNMLFTSDPELNKQRRRQVGPALSFTGLRKMEPTILAAGAQQLLDKWNGAIEQSPTGKAKVCYEKDFFLMGFDIISSLGFGKTHRSLTTGDLTVVRWVRQSVIVMFMQMMAGKQKLSFIRLLIKSQRKGAEEFIAFANRSIEERKQLLAEGAAKPNDILQAYIDAEDPESKIRMTPSQVTAEVALTLGAGAETSSNTLTWTVHLLMLHPQYYRRAVDEVRSNFDKDHLITFDEIKEKLPFLEACVYESMRIRPTIPSLPRIVPPGGVTFQGHFIPEGYTCLVAIPAANMNRDMWSNPHIFNPERFIDNEENKRNVLTFSSGVRICPGRHLAWVEILTTLANLFNVYDFALPGDALFTPDHLDKHGQPVIMPQKMSVSNGPRFPERDCQGHFIPEGYTCLVAIPAANMNRDMWSNPHIFNPERFIDNEENKRNVLTFSSGVRICPGRHLAWVEILTTLANLFNVYDFALPGDALFTPDHLDKHGQPVIMPQKMSVSNGPRFPERDCQTEGFMKTED
ncbi:cytochrome P450 [Martensiomyces pterosporus]|nr:cytochrome P450 [Martensiomyces pterosporus]